MSCITCLYLCSNQLSLPGSQVGTAAVGVAGVWAAVLAALKG